jgi:hypothetical protein
MIIMAGRKYMFPGYLRDHCEEVTGVDRCKGCQYSFRVIQGDTGAKRYFCERKLYQMCLEEERLKRTVALEQEINNYIDTYGKASFREVLMNCGMELVYTWGELE